MPALNNKDSNPAKKCIFLGRQGSGKTTSFASLVCLGQKLRIHDPDKGTKSLQNILLDREHFPYADYLLRNKIDLGESSFLPIDQEMNLSTVDRIHKDPNGRTLKTTKERILRPKNAEAWLYLGDSLYQWLDEGKDLGNIYSWGPDITYIMDTASTAARFAYYYHQALNDRLGTIEDGYDYQRDVGGAQVHLRRLIEVLFSDAVKCNVIIVCHITWIDESKGFNQSPGEMARRNQHSDPDGLPEFVGQALSPRAGKYFNNVFALRSDSSGDSRRIWTRPIDRIPCKRAGWLEDSYDISTGWAEIYSQLDGIPLPKNFKEELGKKKDGGETVKTVTSAPPPPTPKPANGIQRPRPLT